VGYGSEVQGSPFRAIPVRLESEYPDQRMKLHSAFVMLDFLFSIKLAALQRRVTSPPAADLNPEPYNNPSTGHLR
jgi:hypothetical protein